MITHLVQRFFHYLSWTFRTFKEERGWAGIVRLGRVIKRVFYARSGYMIFAYALSDQIPLPALKSGLVILQVTTSEEIASLSVIARRSNRRPGYTNWLQKIFNEGGIGLIAWQNDQPAGWCWASQKAEPSLTHIRISLRLGDIYGHTLFVSPMHRRQGIGQALVAYRLRLLREHGYKRVITAVSKDNISALRFHKKVGYVHIGDVTHTRILFWNSYKYNMFDA